MAHVLCITSGLTGILHASFELASRLEAAGHRVTYLSPSPVREAVEAQGLRFEQLPAFEPNPAPPSPHHTGRLAKVRNIAARWTSRRDRYRAGAEALQIEQRARILGSLKADLALVDMEAHESVLAAQTLGLPLVLVDQFFSSWKRHGLPPLKTDIIPDRGASGQAWEIAQAWLRAGLRVRKQQVERIVQGRINRGDVLAFCARQRGFPRRELQRASFPPPFLYRTLPVISMTMQALEFPHEPRPGMHYVGPMVAARRRDPHLDAEVEARVEAFIEQSRTSGKPLVYCTVSSMNPGDTAWLKKLIAIFADRQDWVLVLGLGGKIEASALGPLPPNVSAFAWTPQLRLLEVAACSVNHGGIHTINECVHFGVPMLVYSGKQFDQDGNAARVAYHGLGLRGDKDRDSTEEIAAKLERVLTEPGFKTAADRFRRRYLEEREQGRLEEVVDTLLAEGASGHE